jgi:hypothetical protein
MLLDRLLGVFKQKSAPAQPPKVHDYRSGGWGHDFHFRPKDGTDGHEGGGCGWGQGVNVGDILMLGKRQGSPYRVVSVKYFWDPRDMFSARLEYATGTEAGDRWLRREEGL